LNQRNLDGTKYLLIVLLAITAIVLMATPVYGQLLSTQRLQLNVYTYANHPVNQFTVTATYKGETQTKTRDYNSQPKTILLGQQYVVVSFLFSPKIRGLADLYNACVTNLSTAERDCSTGYWLPGLDHGVMYMEIFANQ
jgi:hypothetical protein